jgi:hypothetical protein
MAAWMEDPNLVSLATSVRARAYRSLQSQPATVHPAKAPLNTIALSRVTAGAPIPAHDFARAPGRA